MAAFVGKIVAIPTARKAVTDKLGKVIDRKEVTRIVLEPVDADDAALVTHLFEMLGDNVKVSITLEQPGLLE